MDKIKIEEQMQDWFLHFDENVMQFKLMHGDDFDLSKFELREVKKGVDSNVKKIEQEEGAGRS